MEWRAPALVLSGKPFGNSDLMLSILTRDQGRSAGLMRGGSRRRQSASHDRGTLLDATWRARLPDQLGHLGGEVLVPWAARLLSRPLQLAALASLCDLLDMGLARHDPHPQLFDASLQMLEALDRDPAWEVLFCLWEMLFLAEAGYGLDLRCCAVSGATTGLTHISPRSGRAVCAGAVPDWTDRLLVLPPFLAPGTGWLSPPDDQEQPLCKPVAGRIVPGEHILQALTLTGFFLERLLREHGQAGLPASRYMLLERLQNNFTPERSPE